MEDKDDVEQELNAFRQHDEESGEKEVMEQSGHNFTTDLYARKQISLLFRGVIVNTVILC